MTARRRSPAWRRGREARSDSRSTFWAGMADLGRLASAWSSADASPCQTLIAEAWRSGRPGSSRTSSSPTTLRPTTTLHHCCSSLTTPRLDPKRSQRPSTLLSTQPKIPRGGGYGSSSWSVGHRRSPQPARAPTSGLMLFDRRTPRMKASILSSIAPPRSPLTMRNWLTRSAGLCLLRHTDHSATPPIRYQQPTFLSG